MNSLTPYAAFILRIAVGGIFLHHGIMKDGMGLSGVAGFFHGVGLPFATVGAAAVLVVENLGAACVILGIFTRAWALAMAIEMAVASFMVLWPQGHMPELELMLLAGSLTLIALGDGPLSIGIRFKKAQ
ncbi:MAG TPA: DoxX family protein [Gemmatimonadales bacterium]|nr:DoxX family protein [Gemmatimonadales bacterium]